MVELKKNNPNTLFIVRECENVDPVVMARYGKRWYNIDYGNEKKIICEFATTEEVEDIVSKLVIEGEKINKSVNNKI